MKGEYMDEMGDMKAMKEALGGLRTTIRDYGLRRPSAKSEPDGNVGEVMEREPEVEHSMESPADEQVEEAQYEPEKRTVLSSFTPQIVRNSPMVVEEETLHVKRGPGRPRKAK